MILMEEYINKIMLLRLPSHMDKIVECIMEMMVKNHLARKRRIQDQSIQASQKNAQLKAILSKEIKKDGRNGYQHH